MDLIKITEQNGKSAVSARELYRFLFDDNGHYARWVQRNILSNQFAIDGQDYEGFARRASGNETMDYALTIDFAKRLAMMAKSEKGELARSYFIECEKKAKQQLPTTYKEALIALVAQVEENEKQALQIAEMEPKADFYDMAMQSKDTIDIGELSKVLNCGLGRNKLFQRLREEKILMANNIPYQSHITSGHFKIVETTFKTKDEQTHIHLKTVVFQKGVDYIRKVLKGK